MKISIGKSIKYQPLNIIYFGNKGWRLFGKADDKKYTNKGLSIIVLGFYISIITH